MYLYNFSSWSHCNEPHPKKETQSQSLKQGRVFAFIYSFSFLHLFLHFLHLWTEDSLFISIAATRTYFQGLSYWKFLNSSEEIGVWTLVQLPIVLNCVFKICWYPTLCCLEFLILLCTYPPNPNAHIYQFGSKFDELWYGSIDWSIYSHICGPLVHFNFSGRGNRSIWAFI